MTDLVALAALGILAGVLTTIAGLGGGLMLVSVLSFARGPLEALTLTAPALLLGNVHRVWMFRRAIDKRIALPLVSGAGLGALVGSLVLVGLPTVLVQALIVLVIAYALAKESGFVDWQPKTTWLFPTGLGAGFIASSSGAAVVVAPMLVAGGLAGEAFVATSAAVAIAIHCGRVIGFGMEGVLDVNGLLASGLLAVTILAGNEVGRKLRGDLGEARCRRVTIVALVGSLIAALAGLAIR
jgi:uncharacterized membrane protein YfcA